VEVAAIKSPVPSVVSVTVSFVEEDAVDEDVDVSDAVDSA